MHSDIVLEARGIRQVFRTGEEELEVLRSVDLQIGRGEMVAIMGASGVGKSTLLHILGTLDRPTTGQLCINAVDVLGLRDDALADFRNKHIGFVFQFHHLLPEFSALENVMIPAMIAAKSLPSLKEEATELSRHVGLEGRLHHRPGELSGGECQRVSMVRALIMKPLLVLADEPSGNLDEASSDALHALIEDIARTYGQAFLVMTHDRTLASKMDRLGHIEAGTLHIARLETD